MLTIDIFLSTGDESKCLFLSTNKQIAFLRRTLKAPRNGSSRAIAIIILCLEGIPIEDDEFAEL
jgi:hypothetical protein